MRLTVGPNVHNYHGGTGSPAPPSTASKNLHQLGLPQPQPPVAIPSQLQPVRLFGDNLHPFPMGSLLDAL